MMGGKLNKFWTMKNKILLLSLLFQLSILTLEGQNAPMLFGKGEKKVVVNNRILAKVNGKAISVLDVMKKMDMLFYRQYPQYADNMEARQQFYSMYWKNALQECIDKELIMADAQEAKMEVSNGDVRQEMESLFGPNIIANLDKAGLTYEEALQMIKDDMTIKRMLGGRVNAVAIKMVTPIAVHNAYEDYLKSADGTDKWVYQVISIRGQDPAACTEIAEVTYRLLTTEKTPIDQLAEKISETRPFDDTITFKISEDFQHTPKEVSKEYGQILSSLKTGEYSRPMSQKSRVDQSTVDRIFYLKSIDKGDVKSFDEIEGKIREKLIDMMVAKETEKYLTKLRKHHNVNEELLRAMVPDDFQPFALK
jgi:hypothetical protein